MHGAKQGVLYNLLISLEIIDNNGDVQMRITNKMALASAALLMSANASATVFTFDDVPAGSTQNTYGAIGNYNGFNFNCISCSSDRLDWIDTVDSSWNYGAVSGDFTLLNNYGGTGVITEETGADFVFSGLYAKKWATAPDSGGTTFLAGTLEGYNNGILVWSVDTALNGDFQFFGAQSASIDELRLNMGYHFLVDNLMINEVSAVPVPAAVWLFGTGLLGLVGVARRRK